MSQDYVAVYFPNVPGYLCEQVGAAAKELADPLPTRETIERGLRSKEGQRMARAMFDDLLVRTFGAQAPELLMALAQPLDREYARMVRGEMRRQGPETCEKWAAMVGLSKVANLSILAPRQWRAYARSEWLAAGLAKYPTLAPITCPNCQEGTVALVKLSYLVSQPDNWRIACSGCGYQDCNVPQPPADADGYFSEQTVRVWLERSPAARDNYRASHGRRQQALEALKAALHDFVQRLTEEVTSNSASLPASWREVRTVGAWRSHFHLYPMDNVETVLSLPRQGVGRSPDLFWETGIDRKLYKAPLSRTELLERVPSHVAPHWVDAFEGRLASLKDALAADEALEASVQALQLVEDCRRNGLLTSVVLRVNP